MLEVYFKKKWVNIEEVKYAQEFPYTEIVSASYEDGKKLTRDELDEVWVDCGGTIYDEWLTIKQTYRRD